MLLYFLSPLKGTYGGHTTVLSMMYTLELEDQPATATPLEEAKWSTCHSTEKKAGRGTYWTTADMFDSCPGLGLGTVQIDLDREQRDLLHVRLIFGLSKINFRFADLQNCTTTTMHCLHHKLQTTNLFPLTGQLSAGDNCGAGCWSSCRDY